MQNIDWSLHLWHTVPPSLSLKMQSSGLTNAYCMQVLLWRWFWSQSMIDCDHDNDEGDLHRTVSALTNATCMLLPLPRSCLFATDQCYSREPRSVLAPVQQYFYSSTTTCGGTFPPVPGQSDLCSKPWNSRRWNANSEFSKYFWL